MSSSQRIFAGALSAPLAVLLAIFAAHLVYGVRGPLFHMDTPGSYRMTLIGITVLCVLGVVGAMLARYIRLTIVGAGHDAR
jgi:hypothetical protein